VLVVSVYLIEIKALGGWELLLELLLFLGNLTILGFSVDSSDVDTRSHFWETSSLFWSCLGGSIICGVILSCTAIVKSFHDLTICSLKLIWICTTNVRLIMLENCLLHSNSIDLSI